MERCFDRWGDARYTKWGAIVHCFKVTVHCCVLCDATQGSLSLGISNITRLLRAGSIHKIYKSTVSLVPCLVCLSALHNDHQTLWSNLQEKHSVEKIVNKLICTLLLFPFKGTVVPWTSRNSHTQLHVNCRCKIIHVLQFHFKTEPFSWVNYQRIIRLAAWSLYVTQQHVLCKCRPFERVVVTRLVFGITCLTFQLA